MKRPDFDEIRWDPESTHNLETGKEAYIKKLEKYADFLEKRVEEWKEEADTRDDRLLY